MVVVVLAWIADAVVLLGRLSESAHDPSWVDGLLLGQTAVEAPGPGGGGGGQSQSPLDVGLVGRGSLSRLEPEEAQEP